jgi:tetratricopeptide (TPR) repeat protein
VSDPGKAVFLSYASQDAEAAKRICDALRAAGVEVWFDQSELVGGDAWDQKIRKQIKECALLIPVISANTNSRPEGYFRLEWKLAVDRSHLLADDHPFLLPVVIDDTPEAAARVPDKFRDVQWTRLSVKDTPETLAARVGRLLGGAVAGPVADRAPDHRSGPQRKRAPTPPWFVPALAGLLVILALAIWRPWHGAEKPPVAPAGASAAPQSDARQLAERARVLIDTIDSTADDFATAEGLVKRALELDANDGEIWAVSSRLNSSYVSRSFDRANARREAARSQAERAIKLAPDSTEAMLALARAIWTADYPRADAVLHRALAQSPKDGRILLSLGSLDRLQMKLDDALAYYEQAAALPESMPLARYDQFLTYLYERRFADADRCVRQAAAALPTVNFVTGEAMLEITWHGRPAEAQRMLAAAPARMSQEPRFVFASAVVALMNRQPDEALQALDRHPGDTISDAWYTGPKALFVGLAYAQAGRAEAARVAWEAGLAVARRQLQEAPNDIEQHLRLGELLAWTGQTDAALREARICEESQRQGPLTAKILVPDWTDSPARIYAALGHADEAVPLLKELLAAPPSLRWPLTPALLRLDPLWDKLRGDARFQNLTTDVQ